MSPQFDNNISTKDFNEFYWLKKELIQFCSINKKCLLSLNLNNKHIRSFVKDKTELSRNDAITYWKLKRAQRDTNEYDQKDLELKYKQH